MYLCIKTIDLTGFTIHKGEHITETFYLRSIPEEDKKNFIDQHDDEEEDEE